MIASEFISHLSGVQGRGPRWRAFCPSHQTGKHTTRSLSILEADDGRILIRCFGGCDVHAITGALGLQLDDLFPTKHVGSKTAIKKPFPVSEVVRALEPELVGAWKILRMVARGMPIDDKERIYAGKAAERCEELISEILR